ncbi:hypothetical protein [Streptomyces sp. NRRL S-337]|uniref:hypothetical protein n=1 Tax=Streptomyces sp. NRRL S-337 TaxID=1463900 RepID=UPI000A762400|nr:hypothetical protein [Streptomyces sp. NRRL S-337]
MPDARNCAPRFPSDGFVGPADVAALAVHLMVNNALTGGTYDIDGSQQPLQPQESYGHCRSSDWPSGP